MAISRGCVKAHGYTWWEARNLVKRFSFRLPDGAAIPAGQFGKEGWIGLGCGHNDSGAGV